MIKSNIEVRNNIVWQLRPPAFNFTPMQRSSVHASAACVSETTLNTIHHSHPIICWFVIKTCSTGSEAANSPLHPHPTDISFVWATPHPPPSSSSSTISSLGDRSWWLLRGRESETALLCSRLVSSLGVSGLDSHCITGAGCAWCFIYPRIDGQAEPKRMRPDRGMQFFPNKGCGARVSGAGTVIGN